MSRHGHRTTLDRFFLSLTALFVLGGFTALGFLRNVTEENRALFVMVSSLGSIGCLAAMILLSTVWRRLRQWTWQRAIMSWNRSSQAGSTPKFVIPDGLEESELRGLAIQVYSQIGYGVVDRTEQAYLRLVNPEGRIELVACKRQTAPLALHHVYSLDLEMKRTRAARGFIWAPAGFTDESVAWAAHRFIVLADASEIGRLVDCARAKGSRLLEH